MSKAVHPKTSVPPRQSSVQAVERALRLLQLVAAQELPVSVTRLAELSGLNRATVWRLIGTLEHCGFVVRDLLTRGYGLGFAATEICTSTIRHYGPLVRAARSAMLALQEETQESVTLGVARHSGILTIEQVHSPHTIRLKDYTNSITPLHCSSNGKVFLSRLTGAELDSLLHGQLEKLTPHTVIDVTQLRQELAQVARDGYGMVCEELSENENGISAPILKGNRRIAFLNVSGPSFRFTREHMLQLAPRLKEACAQVADQLPDTIIL